MRSDPSQINLVEIEIADVTAHSMGMLAADPETNQMQNWIVLDEEHARAVFGQRRLLTKVEDQTHLLAQDHPGRGWTIRSTCGSLAKRPSSCPLRRPKGTRFWVEVSYDVDGLMQATFTDPATGLAFGNVNIDRMDNLSSSSVDEKRVRLEGMAIG